MSLQFRSGGGGAIQTVGYDGSQLFPCGGCVAAGGCVAGGCVGGGFVGLGVGVAVGVERGVAVGDDVAAGLDVGKTDGETVGLGVFVLCDAPVDSSPPPPAEAIAITTMSHTMPVPVAAAIRQPLEGIRRCHRGSKTDQLSTAFHRSFTA